MTGFICGRGCPVGDSLSFDRAPANVATAEAVRPADNIDSSVGAALCLANTLAACAYVEHAPAVGEDAIAVGFGAGVKDLHAVYLRGCVESFNNRAFIVISWITLGSHHHSECCVRIPAQIEILQLSIARGQQGGDQIGHQPQH